MMNSIKEMQMELCTLIDAQIDLLYSVNGGVLGQNELDRYFMSDGINLILTRYLKKIFEVNRVDISLYRSTISRGVYLKMDTENSIPNVIEEVIHIRLSEDSIANLIVEYNKNGRNKFIILCDMFDMALRGLKYIFEMKGMPRHRYIEGYRIEEKSNGDFEVYTLGESGWEPWKVVPKSDLLNWE